MVEFALIFGFLVMLALGAFEYGMLFRDYLSVTIAAREGGRVAASAANYGDADCVVLEATAGALQSFNSGTVTQVDIYKSNAAGAYAVGGSVNQYRPMLSGEESHPDLVACASTSWIDLGSNWPPLSRINTEGAADWIGVEVSFDHHWFTGFLWWTGDVALGDDAVFRLEPPAPS